MSQNRPKNTKKAVSEHDEVFLKFPAVLLFSPETRYRLIAGGGRMLGITLHVAQGVKPCQTLEKFPDIVQIYSFVHCLCIFFAHLSIRAHFEIQF